MFGEGALLVRQMGSSSMRHFSGEFEGVRLLMLDELEAIAGGDGEDTDSPPNDSDGQTPPDIIVNGVRPPYLPFFDIPWTTPWSGGGDPPPLPPPPPDCHTSNPIGMTQPADNAKYYAPEGVDDAYMIRALNHIQEVSNNNLLNRLAVKNEIVDMYTNPSNPFFVDFKDWGTSRGPAGTATGGEQTYHSDVTGSDITTNLFEPFGNYFFGFLTTWAGFSPEETYFSAAWSQEGSTGWVPHDDPRDTPHVSKGIADAQKYLANPNGGAVFSVQTQNCP